MHIIHKENTHERTCEAHIQGLQQLEVHGVLLTKWHTCQAQQSNLSTVRRKKG